MVLTRRRNFQVFGTQRDGYYHSILDESNSVTSADDLLTSGSDDDVDSELAFSTQKHLPSRRRCCGFAIYTPSTSQFAHHLHSRILQKFPFLIEMFYWIITYLFYRMTKVLSQKIFSESIWKVSEDHGLAVLQFEQFSWLSFLFPWKEHEVQQWFMHGHQTALTILNRAYALIHIPGTVGFAKLADSNRQEQMLTLPIASSPGTITSPHLTPHSQLFVEH